MCLVAARSPAKKIFTIASNSQHVKNVASACVCSDCQYDRKCCGPIGVQATSFPQICGVGASYNTTLFHAIGDATGTEGRGKNNNVAGGTYHGLTFWAPNVNIFRDPRWGRGTCILSVTSCLPASRRMCTTVIFLLRSTKQLI